MRDLLRSARGFLVVTLLAVLLPAANAQNPCVTFDALVTGTQYVQGDSFTSDGYPIDVVQFFYSDNTPATGGTATVSNTTDAGGSGKEMFVSNVNLDIDFGGTVDGVTALFADAGGNNNLRVNGALANVDDMGTLNGTMLGGVQVAVSVTPGNPDVGTLTLTGPVAQFAIGGQEFSLDDICPGPIIPPPPTRDCITFESVPAAASYVVGDTFTSEGASIDVVQFFWTGGGPATGGNATVSTANEAGGSGQEMSLNNVSLEFNPPAPVDGMSALFANLGGNTNLRVNGDLANVGDLVSLDGTFLGGVLVEVNMTSATAGELLLRGTVHSFSIGGQEFFLDEVCRGEFVAPPGSQPCVNFDDLRVGTSYALGDSFVSGLVPIDVVTFFFSNGQASASGSATVSNSTQAGGSGLEMFVSNVSLEFDFGGPVDGVTALFADQGGNTNLRVNGELANVSDLSMLDGISLGGVLVSVKMNTAEQGELMLRGPVADFAIGGQEFSLDEVCPGRRIPLPQPGNCVTFNDLNVNTQYNVGDSFASDGVPIDVESFTTLAGGTTSGNATVVSANNAGGSGFEMVNNNVILDFDFGGTVNGVSALFADQGGSVNLRVNGDLAVAADLADLHNTAVGGVLVNVTMMTATQGKLVLLGPVNGFAIGGQEFSLDDVCAGSLIEPPEPDDCVTFDDLNPGTQYTVGNSFVSDGQLVEVEPFFFSDGTSTNSGSATVVGTNQAGGSGQEMSVSNVNLSFTLSQGRDGLSALFADFGGNVNLRVNGVLANEADLQDLNGTSVGGVLVFVNMTTANQGKIILQGIITDFAIGGQEFFLDTVCLGDPVEAPVPGQPNVRPALGVQVTDLPIHAEAFLYIWESDGDDQKTTVGPTKNFNSIFFEGTNGATFDEGERWTVTVVPLNGNGEPGDPAVGIYLIGPSGTITFEGWSFK